MMQMFQSMKGGGGKGWGGNGGGGKGWGGGGAGGKGGGGRFKRDSSKTVWVGNIPEGISQDEIKENFSSAGKIVRANLTKGRTGIIEYSTAAEAAQAISMFNGSDVGGSALHVDKWESTK